MKVPSLSGSGKASVLTGVALEVVTLGREKADNENRASDGLEGDLLGTTPLVTELRCRPQTGTNGPAKNHTPASFDALTVELAVALDGVAACGNGVHSQGQ